MLKTLVQLFLVVAGFAPGFGYDKYTTHIQNGNPYNLTVDMTPFIKINESYYVFGQTKVNWYVAYENCRRLQSELVTFETAEEFDAIAAFLMPEEIAPSTGPPAMIWAKPAPTTGSLMHNS
uniref:IP10278p n=1 Tax=Drosophila melanogaster TaxID=7227 RepID=D0IQA8_DROME|nr:IP10278p [Drosophila melanogaster]